MAEPYYCTADDLRAELGVTNVVLDDAAAARLIETAEDATDALLGGWVPDDVTGRKIEEDDVEPWQWLKLGRFTMLLAAKLYTAPALLEGVQWQSQSGPDFSVSGRVGGVIPSQLLSVLDDSGLRRLAGRAQPSAGRNQRLAASFFDTERG